MKYAQLVSKLGDALEVAAVEGRKHQEMLGFFHKEIRAEERNLRLKLEAAKDKASRKQLKRELNAVKEASSLLAVAA